MTANPATEPAIERILDLRAAPARVWRAITEPTELAAWFGQRCELDLRPGGRGWFEWDGDGRFEAIVVAVEEGRHLAWRWARDAGTPVETGPSTLVELTLEPWPTGGTASASARAASSARRTGRRTAAAGSTSSRTWQRSSRTIAGRQASASSGRCARPSIGCGPPSPTPRSSRSGGR